MWDPEDVEPDRISRALAASHRVTSRLEVWVEGAMVAEAAPFIDGDVTDEWVQCGIRRHISVKVPPTRKWLAWFDSDQIELHPYRGIVLSKSVTVECPLGVYPLLTPEMSRPIDSIDVSADDFYDRIKDADFTAPENQDAGVIVDAIGKLVAGAGLPYPTDLSSSTASGAATLLERSRHDALVDAAKAAAVEVYMDRLGNPTIADVRTLLGTAQSVLLATGIELKPDWDDVYNMVSAKTTASGVNFDPQVATIQSWADPAHPYRLGSRDKPNYRVKHYSSPLLLDEAQAMKAAQTILLRVSAAARSYSYEVIPDPRRDAGDTVSGPTTTGGTVLSQIDKITHPLKADGKQSITTVSTQPVATDDEAG